MWPATWSGAARPRARPATQPQPQPKTRAALAHALNKPSESADVQVRWPAALRWRCKHTQRAEHAAAYAGWRTDWLAMRTAAHRAAPPRPPKRLSPRRNSWHDSNRHLRRPWFAASSPAATPARGAHTCDTRPRAPTPQQQRSLRGASEAPWHRAAVCSPQQPPTQAIRFAGHAAAR
eukprot:4237744-Alexandrium_andersonii.AAC.1